MLISDFSYIIKALTYPEITLTTQFSNQFCQIIGQIFNIFERFSINGCDIMYYIMYYITILTFFKRSEVVPKLHLNLVKTIFMLSNLRKTNKNHLPYCMEVCNLECIRIEANFDVISDMLFKNAQSIFTRDKGFPKSKNTPKPSNPV